MAACLFLSPGQHQSRGHYHYSSGDQSAAPSTCTWPLSDHNASYVPSRKNAVLLEDTSGVTQDRVLRVVADRIGGRKKHYCSRLSNGIICLYLSNSDRVSIMTEGGGIVAESKFIPCRRYVWEDTKIVLSNYPLELTNDEMKQLLQPYGRIVSFPTRLRVTTAHDDLKHIKSWRCSIFMMLSNEGPQLPPRLTISPFDGVKHNLYIEKDELMHLFIHTPGHLEEKC